MKKKTSLITIILYLLLIALISALIFIYYFNKKLGKELITSAENQVKYITILVMNNSIKKYQEKNTINNILDITKNNKGEITFINYNTKKINTITNQITEILEEDLQNMTIGKFNKINLKLDTITQEYYEKIEDGLVFVIPVSTFTTNPLLANIGPKIPIKLKIVGGVNTNITPKVTEYGLNNAMIELYVDTKTTVVIQMPFLSKELTIKNKIPISLEMIQGILPDYYIANK